MNRSVHHLGNYSVNQIVNQSISQLASYSVGQCFCSDTRHSQQSISPIRFLFLKLPPPPCAVLLVKDTRSSVKIWNTLSILNWYVLWQLWRDSSLGLVTSQTQKAHENTMSKALLMLVLTQNAFSSHRKYSHPVAWLGGAPGAFTKASLLQNAQWYTGLLRQSETSEKHEQNKLLHSGTCHALFAWQDLYLRPRILRSLRRLCPLPGREEPHIKGYTFFCEDLKHLKHPQLVRLVKIVKRFLKRFCSLCMTLGLVTSPTQKAHENTMSKALLMLVLTQNAFSSHRKYSHPVAWLGGAPGAFTKASLLQNAQWYTGLLRQSETSEKHEQNKLLHSGTCHALFAWQKLYLRPRILRSLRRLCPLPGREEPHIKGYTFFCEDLKHLKHPQLVRLVTIVKRFLFRVSYKPNAESTWKHHEQGTANASVNTECLFFTQKILTPSGLARRSTRSFHKGLLAAKCPMIYRLVETVRNKWKTWTKQIAAFGDLPCFVC